MALGLGVTDYVVVSCLKLKTAVDRNSQSLVNKYWSRNFPVFYFAPLPLGEGSGVRENTAEFLLQYLWTEWH